MLLNVQRTVHTIVVLRVRTVVWGDLTKVRAPEGRDWYVLAGNRTRAAGRASAVGDGKSSKELFE
jgi:hypothetical protein